MLTFVPEALDSGDAYRLFSSLIVPRPIAWVSTISPGGSLNLAPFSFFNAVSSDPPIIMFSLEPREGVEKDTLRNVRATGEFVLNVVDAALARAMVLSSEEFPFGVSEYHAAGLEVAASVDVRPPRVASAPAALEARVTQILPVLESDSTMVFGLIVRYHIRPDLLGRGYEVDPLSLRPLARLGSGRFARIREAWRMEEFGDLSTP